MLELKFAIDHRAAKSLSSQASSVDVLQYGLKNHWPRHLFKHWVNMDSQNQTALHVS